MRACRFLINSLEVLSQRRRIYDERETGNSLLCTSVAERIKQLAKRHHKHVLLSIQLLMLQAVKEDR